MIRKEEFGSSGSTAVVALKTKSYIHFSNRVVVQFQNESFLEYSTVHKFGISRTEDERVLNAASSCKNERNRVVKDGVSGSLDMTRAFGDFSFTPCITTSPSTSSILLKEEIKHVIMFSDGLIESMSFEDMFNSIDYSCFNPAKMISIEGELRGSKDDISAIIMTGE